MPGNWHVRFGGGPYGKGPANCGHLAVRPTQPSAERRVCPYRAQIAQAGAAPDGRRERLSPNWVVTCAFVISMAGCPCYRCR